MTILQYHKDYLHLSEEASLAKTVILTGFDMLNKANFFNNRQGYFYSAFFNISIGLERILKLAMINHHMLNNDLKKPSKETLKKDYGHKIGTLYEKAINISKEINKENCKLNTLEGLDQIIINFFHNYGNDKRYFNLNEIGKKDSSKHILHEWIDITNKIYFKYTKQEDIKKTEEEIYREIKENNFHLMPVKYLGDNKIKDFGEMYRQHIYAEKSSPLVIWRIIDMLRPVYYILEDISNKTHTFDGTTFRQILPSYFPYFFFLTTQKQEIMDRRNWADYYEQDWLNNFHVLN